jgi:hypothetical protein
MALAVVQSVLEPWVSMTAQTTYQASLPNPPSAGNTLLYVQFGVYSSLSFQNSYPSGPSGTSYLGAIAAKVWGSGGNDVAVFTFTRIAQSGDGQAWTFSLPGQYTTQSSYGWAVGIIEVSGSYAALEPTWIGAGVAGGAGLLTVTETSSATLDLVK